MATRSLIGIANPQSGTITTIYNHFDGYPQGVGVQLALNYGEKETKRLIKLGNRRSLGGKPSKKDTFSGEYEYPVIHFSFAQLEEYVTRTDVRYVYIGQHIAGYGFAWTAYSVEYGPEHDIAKGIIDKSLKRLGIVRPEVKFEATHAA